MTDLLNPPVVGRRKSPVGDAVLAAVRALTAERGCPPTAMEVAERCGFTDGAAAAALLHLRRRGRLTEGAVVTKRSRTLVAGPDLFRLPVVGRWSASPHYVAVFCREGRCRHCAAPDCTHGCHAS